jgi:VanZ family protein
VVALAYVALIFFLSSRPYLHAPGPDFDMKDKIVHALEYAVLGTLLGRAFRGAAGPRSPAVAFLLVLAIGASIAAADEVFQGTVPGRMRDVTDWLADVAGLAMGGGVMVFGARRGRAPAEDSTV